MSYEIRGRVAVITIENPPVNGMSHAVRTMMVEGSIARSPTQRRRNRADRRRKMFSAALTCASSPPKMLRADASHGDPAFESSTATIAAARHRHGRRLEPPLGAISGSQKGTQIAPPAVKLIAPGRRNQRLRA